MTAVETVWVQPQRDALPVLVTTTTDNFTRNPVSIQIGTRSFDQHVRITEAEAFDLETQLRIRRVGVHPTADAFEDRGNAFLNLLGALTPVGSVLYHEAAQLLTIAYVAMDNNETKD